jgi:hypothetical protein
MLAENDRYLDAVQYINVLHRFKEAIAKGKPLKWQDSDEIGNKFDTCTWGMCSDAAEDWRLDELLLPGLGECKAYRYGAKEKSAVVTAKRPGKLRCPLDTLEESDQSAGCFYRCAIFQRRKKPTRAHVIKLYDETIAKAVQSILHTLLPDSHRLHLPEAKLQQTDSNETVELLWGHRKSAGPCKYAKIKTDCKALSVFVYYNTHREEEHNEACKFPTPFTAEATKRILEFHKTEEEKIIGCACSMCGLLPQELEKLQE